MTYMARPERFERPTPRFVVWCSIQLSYGRVFRRHFGTKAFCAACNRNTFSAGRESAPLLAAPTRLGKHLQGHAPHRAFSDGRSRLRKFLIGNAAKFHPISADFPNPRPLQEHPFGEQLLLTLFAGWRSQLWETPEEPATRVA
jgi:hypothetical protein